MSKYNSWIVAVFFVFVLTAYARPEESPIDRDWMAKAKHEITTLFERYQSVAPHLEEVCELRYEMKKQSNTFGSHTLTERSSRLGNNVIRESTRSFEGEPDRWQMQLECDNEDYNFNLTRSQPDGPYALVGYVTGLRTWPLATLSLGFASAPLGLLNNAVKAMEKAAPFTLTHLSFDEAKKVVRIDYTQSHPHQQTHRLWVATSPEWHLVEHQYESQYSKGKCSWTYGITLGNVSFPTGAENQSEPKNVTGAPPAMKIRTRILRLGLTTKSVADFRLPAFGLPEAVDAPPTTKPTPWHLWLLAAAGGCVAVSVAFAYLRRRSSHLARLQPQGRN